MDKTLTETEVGALNHWFVSNVPHGMLWTAGKLENSWIYLLFLYDCEWISKLNFNVYMF